MKPSKQVFLGLDVGGRRIGVATADSIGRIAQPKPTLLVDDTMPEQLRKLIVENDITDIVVGYPRNQTGDPTSQTQAVEAFVGEFIHPLRMPIHWQDESVTSVLAEERLAARKKPYTKADIDAEAACIILQEFLDAKL